MRASLAVSLLHIARMREIGRHRRCYCCHYLISLLKLDTLMAFAHDRKRGSSLKTRDERIEKEKIQDDRF